MVTEHEKKWKFGMLRAAQKIRFDSVHSGVRRKFEKITVSMYKSVPFFGYHKWHNTNYALFTHFLCVIIKDPKILLSQF